MQNKKDLRKQIKIKVGELSPQEKETLSVRVLAKLEQEPCFQTARTVMLFHSLPDEVDTHAFIRRWAERKNILLPVVQGKEMVVRCYEAESAMHQGAFLIEEPAGEDFTDYAAIDLIVVPGVAFDRHGHRLGRGGGFYDRFLSHPALHHTCKVGICFPCQVVDSIPTEPHDLPVSQVISA